MEKRRVMRLAFNDKRTRKLPVHWRDTVLIVKRQICQKSSNQAMKSLPCRAALSRPSRCAVTAWALTELRLHGRKELGLIEGKKMAVLPLKMNPSLS